MKYLVIDSGTTNSRVRLCDEKLVLQAISRQVGAKDVSIAGNSDILKSAIKECIEEVLNKSNISLNAIEAIIASGMISSNVGLAEVPHIPAPVGIEELSKGMQNIYFPEVVDKPITFIPGVKTGFNCSSILEAKDILRGEESEIFGYMSPEMEKNKGESLFVHYGSHHKCIKVKDGKIIECRTAITGELFMAVSQNTILKSSLMAIDDVKPLKDWVEEGVRLAETTGFGRAY